VAGGWWLVAGGWWLVEILSSAQEMSMLGGKAVTHSVNPPGTIYD
jgi:hypothetical protein